jgi:lysozyme
MSLKQKISVGTASFTLALASFIFYWEGGGVKQPDGTEKVYIDKYAPKPLPTACGGITEHMDKLVKVGASFTPEQCQEMMKRAVTKELDLVASVVTVPLTYNQIIALTDFTHNLGIGALKKSTLLKKVNNGDCIGASKEFLKWDKATVNGKLVPLKGLTKRRQAEAELWRSGC